VNGVFLVALCLSIVLDAIQRFVEPQEVSSPKLVLIVGSFGLASNILGLLLFHEHGHSHGGEGHTHSHGATDAHSAAEEGHGHIDTEQSDPESRRIADEAGRVIDVLPENRISNGILSKSPTQLRSPAQEISWDVSPSRRDSAKSRSPNWSRNRRHSRSRSRTYSTIGEIHVHPASFRNEIIAAGREGIVESPNDSETDEIASEPPTEETPMLQKAKTQGSESSGNPKLGKQVTRSNEWHKDHKHRAPQESGQGHGHSHGDLNMRGVFLHVLGDALGNIGVITSALFIWLTDYSWRFYADPAISLVITVIILTTAIPLCKAASRILLQAVPAGISIDDLKDDIEELPGIISAHHIHVWQLSDTKFVASLHVQVEFDFKGEGSARYMQLARAIRRCLHEYGIHSSTIQPEFCVESAAANGVDPEYSSCEDEGAATNSKPKVRGSKKSSKASSLVGSNSACLLECGDECGASKQCCAPGRGDEN
jgi:solute carrier family 30 (zinc transporter), member 1